LIAHESGDAVQGVEEKMRVELHLERLELRLRELRFELRGAHLALAIAFVVADGVARAERRRIDEQVNVKLAHQAPDEHLPERARIRVCSERREMNGEVGEKSEVCGGDEHAGGQVDDEAAHPRSAFERETPTEPEDERRETRPTAPTEHLPSEHRPEGDWEIFQTQTEISLARVEQSEEEPEADDEAPLEQTPSRVALLRVGRILILFLDVERRLHAFMSGRRSVSRLIRFSVGEVLFNRTICDGMKLMLFSVPAPCPL
jgi:hypothetical protein